MALGPSTLSAVGVREDPGAMVPIHPLETDQLSSADVVPLTGSPWTSIH